MKTIILLSVLGIIAMVSDIFGFKKFIWGIVVVALVGIFYVNFMEWELGVPLYFFNDMLFIDSYAIAFSGLILLLALIWFFISKDVYEQGEFNKSDHYALILFSLVGAIVLVSYADLSMLFLGIEILSIPLYILAGSRKKDLASNEAALKYFMMGAFATGILLFGIAFIYGATGTFNLDLIGDFASDNEELPALFYIGIFLIMIGLGFKVSAVPFHFWTPDVYEGSPLLITSFMATIVKTAAFGSFFRLFSICFDPVISKWNLTLAIIAGLTILLGNILAVSQGSAKRMLAYSGIAQAGYLLLTILVPNEMTTNALLLYTASYSLATICAFAVIYWVVKTNGNDDYASFNGLARKNPFLAFVLAVSMLSLAGIPPTAGFFAKFYLFSAILKEGYISLVVIAVIGSLISVYYYFKLIIAAYGKEGEFVPANINSLYKTVLIIVLVIIFFIGISPGLFTDFISSY